jgi:Fur family zinc uptake transcriptional regulator
MAVPRSSPAPKGTDRALWHISTLAKRNPRRYGNSDGVVLDILQASAKPLTAYQIRDEIEDGDRRIAPMQVYRVLQRLIESQRVVRIETLSAYVLADPGVNGIAICQRCGRYTALKLAAAADIAAEVANIGFIAAKQVIEIAGTCGTCRQEESVTTDPHDEPA